VCVCVCACVRAGARVRARAHASLSVDVCTHTQQDVDGVTLLNNTKIQMAAIPVPVGQYKQ